MAKIFINIEKLINAIPKDVTKILSTIFIIFTSLIAFVLVTFSVLKAIEQFEVNDIYHQAEKDIFAVKYLKAYNEVIKPFQKKIPLNLNHFPSNIKQSYSKFKKEDLDIDSLPHVYSKKNLKNWNTDIALQKKDKLPFLINNTPNNIPLQNTQKLQIDTAIDQPYDTIIKDIPSHINRTSTQLKQEVIPQNTESATTDLNTDRTNNLSSTQQPTYNFENTTNQKENPIKLKTPFLPNIDILKKVERKSKRSLPFINTK